MDSRLAGGLGKVGGGGIIEVSYICFLAAAHLLPHFGPMPESLLVIEKPITIRAAFWRLSEPRINWTPCDGLGT